MDKAINEPDLSEIASARETENVIFWRVGNDLTDKGYYASVHYIVSF